jgi:hypothetical protein
MESTMPARKQPDLDARKLSGGVDERTEPGDGADTVEQDLTVEWPPASIDHDQGAIFRYDTIEELAEPFQAVEAHRGEHPAHHVVVHPRVEQGRRAPQRERAKLDERQCRQQQSHATAATEIDLATNRLPNAEVGEA